MDYQVFPSLSSPLQTKKMELPFAVGSSEELPNHSDDGSLVTASSQDDSTILQPYNSAHDASSFASSFLPSRIISAVSQWNNTTTSTSAVIHHQHSTKLSTAVPEMNDYTYVNVWETDEVDIVVSNQEERTNSNINKSRTRETGENITTDLLALLLNPTTSTDLTRLITQANDSVTEAQAAKKQGDLVATVQHQSQAAQFYCQAALHCQKEGYDSLMKSLLLLSQIQSKAVVALQRVVKLPANGLRDLVRGALKEESCPDLTESTFLGEAKFAKTPRQSVHISSQGTGKELRCPDEALTKTERGINPIDEMMALERELRDIDMALEMGQSIASLDARKNSYPVKMDGSFMVVRSALPTPRARANRVQAIRAKPPHYQETHSPLDSSQILSSSVASLAASAVMMSPPHSNTHYSQQSHPENTKQIMRLMDSLKTLGDENAALLRRVEDAERARIEAKMAQKAMENFKEEYNAKFQSLKLALQKFQNDYPSHDNPVNTSTFKDGKQQTDQLIRKLTADLQKEKEQSKKKDATLKKYEAFYKEVKARSAMKQAQRKKPAPNVA